MDVVPYDPRFSQAFVEFNTDWINEYFGGLEERDHEEFASIEKYLAKGGQIFFAVEEETPLAACMVIPIGSDIWEICKLGSNRNVPHKGAGSAVFEACQKWAAAHGAEKIIIITNSALKAALHIYEKFGFREMPMEDYGYSRGDIAFEYVVPAAQRAASDNK